MLVIESLFDGTVRLASNDTLRSHVGQTDVGNPAVGAAEVAESSIGGGGSDE
jgi:hypothetical protein